MDSLFTEPSMEKSPKTSTETDADLFKIPFSATKLRHSLSEGGKPPPKPRNGYHRMHSFHSTLSDGNWDEDDRPTSQSPSSESTFLPSEFRDTIFKDFPGLSKNGFHSHSFDGDIFEETADKFSSGFFSESEIDVIPRSSLFQRTGLRRSTSQVEPERHRRGFRQNCEEAAAQESAERDSRHAKIEELIRLKKKLEDLKASWQSNGDKGGQHEKKVCQKEEKEGEGEDLLESRLKTLKDKGKMKRRRLSSSKRSQSLSSKLMEELLEEDEGSTEIETFDDDDIKVEKEAASSAVKENCGGSLRDGARDKTDEKLEQNETSVDFKSESCHMSPSSVRQSRLDETSRWRERCDTSDQEISPSSTPSSNRQRDTDYGLIFRGGQDEDDDNITPKYSRRDRFDDTQGTCQKEGDCEGHDVDITPRYSSRDRYDDIQGTFQKDVDREEDDDDITPRFIRRDRFDDTRGTCQKDIDYKEEDKDVPFSYVRRRHQYDDSSKWSKRHQSDSARAMSLSDMSPTDKGRSQLNAALVQNKKRNDSEPEDEDWSPSNSRFDDSNKWSSRGTDYGQESDYPANVERNRSDKAFRGKNGRSAEVKDREAKLGRGNSCNDVRPRDSNYKRDGSSREKRRSKFDDAARWAGRGSDPEIDKSRHLPTSPGRNNNFDTTFRQRGRDIIDHKPEGGYEPLSYSRRNKFGNVSREIERGSEEEDGHISPSYETRMNEPLKRSESCINSDCKSWKDEHKESFFKEGEGISVKRKPQSRPVGGRKTSLDNEVIGSSSGQKFRRSFSTSYDVNESRRRTNSSRFGSSRKSSDSDDEKVNPDICSNFRRRSQDLEDEAKNYNIQQDTFSIRSEDNSSHQAAKSYASAAVNFKDKMDRPFLGTGMLGRSPERKSKQSVRPDRFGVDDIFKKFSIPSRDFFEDEFFASDWKRHRLIEEIGGIQRNLADITKRELGKRRNGQGDEKEETGQPSRRRDCEDVKIRRSPSVIDLQTERSNLTGLLKQLICKKQEREQQIRNRIDQLKHENQAEEGEKQDKKCRLCEDGEEEEEEARCNKTDERIEIVQRDGEDEVSFVLRRAGADVFIPIVKKNEITIDRLYQLMPSDFTELGITDPEIQRRLQEEIDRHFVEQKNAQLKAASLERPNNDSKSKDEKEEEDVEGNKELGTPCTPISSAPEGYEPEVPVHVSAECVICMDNQSNLLFLNCGHVCCCYDCAITLSLCPLCRSEIASKLIMNDSLPDASEL